MTTIEWTRGDDGCPGKTWNPTVGCSRVSPGCDNCYAMRFEHRFSGPGQRSEGLTRIGKRGVDWSGRVRLVPEKLALPLSWRKPRRVFVNSTSDLFHESLTDVQIAEVFGVMAVCGGRDVSWSAQSEAGRGGAFHGVGDGYQPCGTWTDSLGKVHQMRMPRYGSGPHTFQILTKRAVRMRRTLGSSSFRTLVERAAYRWAHDRTDAGGLADAIKNGAAWPLCNVWLGVSVESADQKHRLGELARTPAAVRFASLEPLISHPGDLLPWLENRAWQCRKCERRWELGEESWRGIVPTTDEVLCPADDCDGELDAALGTHLDWVIAGAESGNGARPMQEDWVRSLRDQCETAGVSFFYKQRVEGRKKISLPMLDGRQWAEFPEVRP